MKRFSGCRHLMASGGGFLTVVTGRNQPKEVSPETVESHRVSVAGAARARARARHGSNLSTESYG